MKKNYIFWIAALALTITSCQKEFLEQTPQDQIPIENFFKTNQQIKATTAALYGFPWFSFNDKAIYVIGDMLAGNMYTWDGNYQDFMKFSVQKDNVRLNEAWAGLYKVIGMSNSIINILPQNTSSEVDSLVIQQCLGEAKFMRALAYFYLVRGWGAVPVIENSEVLASGSYKINRHKVEDVYKFILRDLEFTEANCPEIYTGADKGRVTNFAAKALMSKVYLYQKNYAKALEKAEEVINSEVYELMPDYADLFKTKKNYNRPESNNRECIFAFQWIACTDCWGQQNTHQAYFAPNGQGITETGDGFGAVIPSIDLVKDYESGDKRKKPTVMTPGDFYPELTSSVNPTGYTYPADPEKTPSSTHANIRKYVVGSPSGPDGPVFFFRTGINTNVLRLAEVYLIAVEAIMAGAGSTSDVKAIKYFKVVRDRAGLITKSTITFDELLHERRIEMALEFDYWYDLGRIERSKAITIIANQERGFYYSATGYVSQKYTPIESDFILPIPQSEVSRNSKLLEEPVAYDFK